MLYMLTESLPWAVTANYDLWHLAHGREALEMWSVTSSGVSASPPPPPPPTILARGVCDIGARHMLCLNVLPQAPAACLASWQGVASGTV